MRKIMKGSAAVFAVLLLVASARTMAAYNKVEKPLYAGQHILIGKLIVEQYKVTVGNRIKKMLRVTYDTTSSGWTMQATHLYVSKNAPTKSAPGRFPFKHEGLDNVTVDVYEIPLSQLLCSDKKLYIAAHADTCEQTACVPDFAAMAASLPTGLTDMNVEWNLNTALFNLNSIWWGGLGWCLDEQGQMDTAVTFGTSYHLSVLPDGSPNPVAVALIGSQASALAGSPVNYLNYLINRPYVKDCGNGGPYTATEIQVAIWHLTNGLAMDAYGANPVNVKAILDDVIGNGADFVPGCGDLVLVVADPQTPAATGDYPYNQHVGLVVPVAGVQQDGNCETAWAKGTVKFCTGWGSYFAYYLKRRISL